MVPLSILALVIVYIVCYIIGFPGGPTGFVVCTKLQLKRKVATIRSYLSKGFNQPMRR